VTVFLQILNYGIWSGIIVVFAHVQIISKAEVEGGKKPFLKLHLNAIFHHLTALRLALFAVPLRSGGDHKKLETRNMVAILDQVRDGAEQDGLESGARKVDSEIVLKLHLNVIFHHLTALGLARSAIGMH